MAYGKKKNNQKSPPILSNEFWIQNHADAVSCVTLLILMGLMFQPTSHICSKFTMLSYNVTVPEDYSPTHAFPHLEHGWLDGCPLFLYVLVAIIAHAIVQEYVLDKLTRKFHLSKSKLSKYNLSGQLIVFYSVSVALGTWIIQRERWLLNMQSVWQGYPHVAMSIYIKVYMLAQMAYWAHLFPALYFQRIRKDDYKERISMALLYLGFIGGAYTLNFSRLSVILLTGHYFVELLFHIARILYFSESKDISRSVFFLWSTLFVLVRLATICLSSVFFLVCLSENDIKFVDFSTGNFNILPVRVCCLAAILLIQLWMTWSFIMFQLKRFHDTNSAKPGSENGLRRSPRMHKAKAH